MSRRGRSDGEGRAVKCPHCGTRLETRLERRRRRFAAKGLCIDCGAEKPDRFKRCRPCRIKQAGYRATSKSRDASRESRP